MALLAKPIDEIANLRTVEERYNYFCEYARYMADAPNLRYMIRVGSETLRSNDTHELRIAFDKAVKRIRRKALQQGRQKALRRGRR